MANRIEGENQLIIDSPTREFDDGTKEVSYYFMEREWPELRDNATIIIDAEKLGLTRQIRFRNGPDALTPWHIESARVINDGKVITGAHSCHGLKHYEFSGANGFSGLKKWAPDRKYTTGHFGFHIINYDFHRGHGIDISVLDGGTAKLDCFEVQYGFSGVRAFSAENPITVKALEISNFYIHDIVRGEGMYLGSTVNKLGLPVLKGVKIHNGFIARTSAEGLQMQHLGGADIRDVILYACDVNWLNSFGKNQNNGIQCVIASGDNYLTNVIVDGFGAMAFAVQGSPQDLANAKTGRAFMSNVLYNEGRNRGMYLHSEMRYGTQWEFDDVYFRAFNNTYEQTGKLAADVISKKHGTDSIHFKKITHDGSKPLFFEDPTNIQIGLEYIDPSLPAPEYENSGFYEPSSKIKRWHHYYANYHENADYTPTKWDAGDIAIEVVGDNYAFYKYNQDDIATEVPPSGNGKCSLLTWDENGIRSDQPGFSQRSIQSMFPPDDLRMKRGSFWRGKGMGIKDVLEKENILDEFYYDGKRYTQTDSNLYIN